MTFVSYAQNFEDVRLWRAFSDVPAGRYLDIGTQDPVQDSVSLACYERGWRGVHVEPTPTYAAAMRAARPDEQVIEAAVTTAPGPMRFFEIPATGLSTGAAAIADRHRDAGWECREIAVATVTLAGLFDFMGPDLIHWLKIDVEGMEADVLASWGNHPARPAALVIEATAPGTQKPTHKAWHAMVIERGYIDVLFDGLSRYFIHESHAQRGGALALSPNVFDGFQVHQKHFTAMLLVNARDEAIEATRREDQKNYDEIISTLKAQIAQSEAYHQSAFQEAANDLEAAKADAARIEREANAAAADAFASLDAAERQLAELEALRAAQAEAQATALANAHDRLASADDELTDIRSRLDAVQQNLLGLTRENGRLEGQVNARIEVYSAKLSEAEAMRRELTARLTGAEEALARAYQEHELARTEMAIQAHTHHTHIVQLSGHVAWREQQLAAASALLDAVPRPLGWLPRQLTGLARRWSSAEDLSEIARHKQALESWRAGLMLHTPHELPQENSSIGASNLAFATTAIAVGGIDTMENDEPITSVLRLMAPHDRQFILTAYQAVLGRAPDSGGEAYYLTRLRAGVHKLEILKQLRRSPEGRAFVPGVAGLDRAIRRHSRATLPLLGALVQLVTGAEGNNATHRQLRILVNDLGRMRGEQASLAGMVQQLASRTAVVAEPPPSPPPPPPPPPPANAEQPPRLDPGPMPESFDSTERRLLGSLRLFSLTHGAPA